MRTLGYMNLRRTSRFSEHRKENEMVVPLSNGDVATFRSGGENAKVLAIAQPQDHGICIHTYIYIYVRI